MSRRTGGVLSTLLAIAALSSGWAAWVMRPTFFASARGEADSLPAPTLTSEATEAGQPVSPCASAMAQRAVCAAANRRALEIINAGRLEAFTVVQDVSTGALVVFAASRPTSLDVNTHVLPLSLSKVLLSASWWDNAQPDASFESTKGTADAQNPAYRSRVSVHEMLVGGSDSAGRQMAVALRKSVGTEAVLRDFKRYGFGPRADAPRDETFWAELAPAWRARLTPAPAYASLSEEMSDAEWAETMSLGEANMSVTGLHVSRFLQAVGNGGLMSAPVAREELPATSVKNAGASLRQAGSPVRVLQERTALRLQSAMRDTVERGTAKSIARTLEGTGWQIGGKTGTGPGPAPIGPHSDGWFAGLIFDPQGKARYTVATFVRRGGPGGGNAAKISVELARFVIGERAGASR